MIEATYYGASSLERSLLRCHTDQRNPCHTKPSLSAVVSLSRRSTLGTRYVIIGAMRKSICNVLEKVDVYERFIEFVVGWCGKLSNGEREYQHSYIDCHGLFTFDGFQGYEARAYPCHVDPQSFHMVYRWYVPALARRFRLSYGEVISVATTFDVMAKSHYFFSVVAESLLRANGEWMDTIMNHHRGFAFGYYILVTMHEIKGRTPLPPCRFNDYKSFDLMTYEEWEKVCCNRCRVALHLSASLPSKPEPNKILPSYKKSLNLLKSTVKGAGVLVTNHAIAIMLVLGLLPSWFYSVAVITGDSKYMEYFSNRFDIPKMDNDQATALGERIALLLRDWSNLHINLRMVENLLCKCFQEVSPTCQEEKWRDLNMSQQLIIIYKGSNKQIYNCGIFLDSLTSCSYLPPITKALIIIYKGSNKQIYNRGIFLDKLFVSLAHHKGPDYYI